MLHPDVADDPRGLNVIVRYAYARADRSLLPQYAGGSAVWHGIGPRHNDTAGIGGNFFTVKDPALLALGDAPVTPGHRSEWSLEAFYKARLTEFFSLQPDLQWFAHPGGANRDAFVAGLRIKAKL